jgi:hypothetical protein
MLDPLRLEDLPTVEIKAALCASGEELSDDQILAIREFVIRVGGLENARLAVEMLAELERAA